MNMYLKKKNKKKYGKQKNRKSKKTGSFFGGVFNWGVIY